MNKRSEAQRLRREREQREKRARAARVGWRKHAARINRVALPPTATPIRAQKAESIEHGQTDGSLYRETCWQNGSEYVCLICRWVSRTPAAHEVHTATAHLGCGIPVTWLEERYYDGAALVPDFRSGVNVWRYAT